MLTRRERKKCHDIVKEHSTRLPIQLQTFRPEKVRLCSHVCKLVTKKKKRFLITYSCYSSHSSGLPITDSSCWHMSLYCNNCTQENFKGKKKNTPSLGFHFSNFHKCHKQRNAFPRKNPWGLYNMKNKKVNKK